MLKTHRQFLYPASKSVFVGGDLKIVNLYFAKAIEHPAWCYSQKLELIDQVTAKKSNLVE